MPYSLEFNGFFCPNRICPDYGKRGLDNLALTGRYGKGGVRLFKCKSCGKRFSERRFSFCYGLHTNEGKAMEVLRCLFKGMSYREAADISGIDKDTVNRIWKKFVSYCEESMGALVAEFNVNLEDLITLLYMRGRKIEQR